MNIEIYGTNNCTFCKQAVALCESKDITPTYTLLTSREQMAELESRVGALVRTVPQIFVDGVHLPGGFSGLKQMLN